jgi:predicted dehydrogenase
VIGGGMGGRLSLDALRSSPQFNLSAAADLKPEIRNALERDFPGLKTFASHEQMLSQYPTDVVCVSTHAPSHEPVVRDVLTLPSLRGILVEKPLGDTAAAGRRILDATRSRGLPMVVPHGLRTRATPLEISKILPSRFRKTPPTTGCRKVRRPPSRSVRQHFPFAQHQLLSQVKAGPTF